VATAPGHQLKATHPSTAKAHSVTCTTTHSSGASWRRWWLILIHL
jgi:hypothetical protein